MPAQALPRRLSRPGMCEKVQPPSACVPHLYSRAIYWRCLPSKRKRPGSAAQGRRGATPWPATTHGLRPDGPARQTACPFWHRLNTFFTFPLQSKPLMYSLILALSSMLFR